jgi:hypothetical protein
MEKRKEKEKECEEASQMVHGDRELLTEWVKEVERSERDGDGGRKDGARESPSTLSRRPVELQRGKTSPCRRL